MSSTLSPQTIPSNSDSTPRGRFAKGNAGGPGNPFARQTAALRAYLIEHVTERDLQDILDIVPDRARPPSRCHRYAAGRAVNKRRYR